MKRWFAVKKYIRYSWRYKRITTYRRLLNLENQQRKKRRRVRFLNEANCLRCGTCKNLTIDHVIPRAKGGTNEQSNWQVLCENCNWEKGTKIIDYR